MIPQSDIKFLNPDTATSIESAATQNMRSPVNGRTLFFIMLGLLGLNALGFMGVLVILPPEHSGIVVLLMLVLFASALPVVVIGWMFYRMGCTAKEVSTAVENLATGPVAQMGGALQAMATGDFEHPFNHPLPVPLALQAHGEAAGLAVNYHKLHAALSQAFADLENARASMQQTYGELWHDNEKLKSELALHEQAEEKLRNEQKQFEARAGQDNTRLSKASEQLERELVEHKRTEDALQRWEQIFKNAGWGMATINATSGVLLSVNPAFAEMHGYHPQELIGQPLETLVAPPAQASLAMHANNANQKKNYSFESVHVRRDGSMFPVLVNTTAVTDPEGGVIYRTANFQDITATKKVEQSLKSAKEEAEKATKAKTQFLARMSHELRTPLNVILGFSQLLDMNLADPEHNESVQHILKAGKHLLSLINEVLDISRIDADKLSLSLQVVPVGEVMLSAIALVRSSVIQRRIEFVDQLNSRGVKHVIADNQRLQQVFLNLLSNAVKYNKTGGKVTVWCSERADNRIAVSVTDTGSGIPAENLSQLFTPFERLGADEVGIEGTGLGLALSKRLVELMDGSLEVSSIPGEGSTFSVVLPVASSPVQKLGKLGDERLTSKEKSALPTTCKLLYIEEDMSNLRLVEKLLKPYHKIGLIFAQNGMQGLEMARKEQPEMILLDLDLPDMPGEKVLEKLHKQFETVDIPIVAISADTRPLRIEQVLKQGASHYLIKPIDVNKLLVAIGESIKIRENLTAG